VNRIYTAERLSQGSYGNLSTDTALTVGMALGDLDGNGWIDVITADDSLAHRYYLNKGYGAYTQAIPLFDGIQHPSCVSLGDLDGDDLLDIVAGNKHEPNCVYLNRGCVQPFLGAQEVLLDTSRVGITCMALGDMNGDALLDVLAGGMNTPVSLYLNKGQVQFSERIPLNNENYATTSIATGDLNNDGWIDVVVGNMKQENFVYINNGDGTLSGYVISPECYGTSSIKIGDVDNDGFSDVVVGNMGRENQLFLNDGKGGFQAAMDISDEVFETFSISLGDVNGDKLLDIVVGNIGDKNRVYINNGRSYPFFGVAGQIISDDSSNTLSIELADINGDGCLDVIAGNYKGSTYLHLNDGSEIPFRGKGIEITGDKDKTFSIACADLDSDGDLDIIAGNAGDQDTLYLNAGTIMPFNDVAEIKLTDKVNETLCVITGDLDKDGNLDILAGYRNTPARIYRNPGKPYRQYGFSCFSETELACPKIFAEKTSNTDVISVAVGEYVPEGRSQCEVPHFSFNACTAVSLPWNYTQQSLSAVSVSLKTAIPPNADVAFYLSNNGGDVWVGAKDRQTVFFPAPGNRLAWKAIFHSLSSVYSARIYEIVLTPPDSRSR